MDLNYLKNMFDKKATCCFRRLYYKGFDLRVIIVGDSYFGYYRYPRKDDYRASGSGIVEKKKYQKKF